MAPARHEACVQVPATSANLGPGFDSLGLALGLVDDVRVSVRREPGARVRVQGEGAGEVPTGEEHLVVRALRAALADLGCAQPPGLDLVCTNRVPHGRGLGSSAAAVVAGVLLGRLLAGAPPDDAAVLALATTFEGHPDNAAAALLGGATVAWTQDGVPSAVRIRVHPDIEPLLLVPRGRLATHHARAVLPASVTHQDAAANVARVALLVHALADDPGLLLAATQDRLHQRQRGPAMPQTLELLTRLRAAGLAAVVSGAGPAVLVLSTRARCQGDTAVLRAAASRSPDGDRSGWSLLAPGVRTTPGGPPPAR